MMLFQILGWVMAAWLVAGILVVPTFIGKQRTPLKGGTAATMIMFNLIGLFIVIGLILT